MLWISSSGDAMTDRRIKALEAVAECAKGQWAADKWDICCCPVRIGHPSFSDHTQDCKETRTAIRELFQAEHEEGLTKGANKDGRT